MNLQIECVDVQGYWNSLENILITITDELAPIVEINRNTTKKENVPRIIKNKINKRKRLLKLSKQRNTTVYSGHIKQLTCEIKEFFCKQKADRVGRNVLGEKRDLWGGGKNS